MNRIWKTILPLAIFFSIITTLGYGQVNRYMVHLTDKDGTSFTIDNPEEFLSQRALDRRQKQNIEINIQDLPVNGNYVAAIGDTGAEVYFRSKWFNAVLVQCDASLISSIEDLSFVREVEYVGPGAKLGPSQIIPSKLQDGQTKTGRSNNRVKQEASEFQNNLLGVDILHQEGITGEGIIIAIMDSGFPGVDDLSSFGHLFDNDKIIHAYDYVGGQADVYRYSGHGTKVFSLLGAYDQGSFVGTAYDSEYMLFITEDDCGPCEHRIEEYNWVFAAEYADSAGVDVLNSSLGYNLFEDPSMSYTQDQMDGNTAIISIASDIAYSKGMLVVSASGNEGANSWGIVTAPADAHNIISVGNMASNGSAASSSSGGPTADNRIKPELVALGSSVKVISSTGNIVSGGGTSYSSPQIAGLGALIWQAYPDLTASDIRFLLMQTASNANNPNNEIGYGLPSYAALENFIAFSDSDESFKLFPNPVDQDNLELRVNNPSDIPAVNLTIYDSNGKQMLNQNIEFTWQNNSYIINMINFLPGVYIFNLNTGSTIEKVRILKI